MRRAKRLVKPYSRALQQGYRRFRRGLSARAPAWMQAPLDRALDYLDLIFVDHGIFRGIYANRHRIAPGIWRSSQPGPRQIARYASEGVRTIINLRGPRDCGSYRLEVEACRRHGVTLIDFPLKSRSVPSRAVVKQAESLLRAVDYPVLIHCKSGADRAGLMSVLVLFLKEGKPLEKAMKQLSLKFGHIRQSDTGILDHFFEHYLAHNRRQPIPFLDWLETAYDPKEIKREFRARPWANLLVNRAFQRE
jgi:protein tyrosine/serine phosphatase